MGRRFRLKADFDVSRFSAHVQVILRAFKKYGMILADNGSAWYISGVPDPRWNNDVLGSELKLVKGSDFEAVDVSSLMVNQGSGEAKQINPPQEPAVFLVVPHFSLSFILTKKRIKIGLSDKLIHPPNNPNISVQCKEHFR
jgi:hypothetical protein